MKIIRWAAFISLIVIVAILLFDKYYIPIFPEFQYAIDSKAIDIFGYHLTLATFIVSFFGILFTFLNLFIIYSVYKTRKNIKAFKKKINKEIEPYTQKIDNVEKNIKFLEDSSHGAMQALRVLLIEYITRYNNLSFEKTLSGHMRNSLAISIGNLFSFLIPHISAREINEILILLVKVPNKNILLLLDDIKDALLLRYERDSKFKEDALYLMPDADKVHPFKRQIESLKEIICEAIKDDEKKND